MKISKLLKIHLAFNSHKTIENMSLPLERHLLLGMS